jgi:hypothetical protein
MFEFGIHDIDRNTVIGRCYKGPLRVGEMFTSFEDEANTTHPVELEITCIEAYNRELEEIDAGLTARLTLRGLGADSLSQRGVLRGGSHMPQT